MIIYVDKMIITFDDNDEIVQLKRYLFQEFEVKYLGELNTFFWN